MESRESSTAIPVSRVACVLRYTHQLQSMGAPVDRLLALAGISAELLEHPAAAVPLENAFRFGELACRALGTEHLGLHVGIATSLDDLGPYGKLLQRSLTLHEYLRNGISLYNMLITGQRFWLSEHGEELRLNLATVGEPGIGSYQSHIESLVISIANLRTAAGPHWSPREISLAYWSREDLPDIDLFAGSRVLRGTGETYITIPRSLMGLRFPGSGAIPARVPESQAARPLPNDLAGLVQLQIEVLLSDEAVHIDTVAETLAVSRRSLQRSLARQGTTYSQLLAETRIHQAANWLQSSDKPIAEIAYALGYTDASNFTRAFRQKTGVSSQTFRDNARKK